MTKKKQRKSNWWVFWDNVNMPLLKKIRRVKREKPSVWDLK